MGLLNILKIGFTKLFLIVLGIALVWVGLYLYFYSSILSIILMLIGIGLVISSKINVVKVL